MVGVCPEIEDTGYEPTLLVFAYPFLSCCSPLELNGLFNSSKGFQVIMPNDAQKPQILSLQFQRPILNHLLKINSIFPMSLRDLNEIDDINLTGLLHNICYSL